MEEGKIFGTNHPAISWQFLKNVIVPRSKNGWIRFQWSAGMKLDTMPPCWPCLSVQNRCLLPLPRFQRTCTTTNFQPAPSTRHSPELREGGFRAIRYSVYLWSVESHSQRLTSQSVRKLVGQKDKKAQRRRFDLDEWPFDQPWWIEIETNKLILD